MSFLFRAKVWDILPNIYKDIDGVDKFKKVIKKGKPDNYPCRICKKYMTNVGFTMFELLIG